MLASTQVTETFEVTPPLDDFVLTVRRMTSKALTGLKMSEYSRVERRIINDELVRRSLERKANKSLINSENHSLVQSKSLSPAEVSNQSSLPSTGQAIPKGAGQNMPKNKNQSSLKSKKQNSAKSNKKNPPKNKSQAPMESSSSLYPELIECVDERLLTPFTFYIEENDGRHAIKEYDTYVSGKFKCSTGCARARWFSGKIAISIRMYSHNRYNALIRHQRCRSCEGLSRPTLDSDTYGQRVSYRLNKWSGHKMEPPKFRPGRMMPPHDCNNCEGCDLGRCPHDLEDEKYIECYKNCRSDR
ncbi:hypothetical protein BGZ98_008814 [Dissophora globulifera]|nr:hypothetical protein BGZ98_008814 [Dissophora globulifera]